MKAEQLRKSILQMAIQGKLVPQDPNDEPASVLLEKIRAEKQKLIKEGKIKKDKFDSVIFKGDDNRHYEKVGTEVKDITDEIDFDLPEGWEYIRLCTVCWLDDTKSISGEKLPYLDAKTLRGRAEKTYLTNGKVVEPGTKIILVDGENSGEVFDVPFKGYMGSTFRILGACKSVHLQYLNVILDYYRNTFKGNKKGAAIPHLNKSLFNSLIIGLPPFLEQKRIVAIIEKYEPLIAEYDQLEKEATALDDTIKDRLKKSILQYAIQGKLVPQDENDEPASVLLERIRAEKKAKLGKKYVDSYIYKGDDNCYYEKVGSTTELLQELDDTDYPDSWTICRLGAVATIFTGNSINEQEKNKKYCGIVSGYNYIGTKDVEFDHSIKYVNGVKIPYDTQFKIAHKGTPLLCIEGGSAGRKIGILSEDVCFGNKLCAFETYILCSKYLYYFLQSPQFISIFKSNTTGIIGGVSVNTIKSLFFALPPLDEQNRIVKQIDSMFSKIKDVN